MPNATTQTAFKPCTCGICPAVRAQRGLQPFCQLPAPASTPRGGYDTAEQAHAANPGKGVVRVRGGMGHAPGRWIARP